MTTVALTGNFLATARCLIFSDAGGLSWNFNQNTNVLTGSPTSGEGTFLSSIGLADDSTAPIYIVGNSPLTANGTLTLTLNTQTANYVFAGPTTGSAAQPSFRALVSTDLPASQPQLTTAANLVTVGTIASGIWQGTAIATAYGGVPSTSDVTNGYILTNSSGTPSWAAAPFGSSADPSATIGLAAVNGTAATFMTSDSAPALSVAITPTWTGAHQFHAAVTIGAPTSGTILTVAGTSGNFTQEWTITGHTVGVFLGSGSSTYGIGTTTNDPFCLFVDGGSAALSIGTGTGNPVTLTGGLGINGNAPPAQSTGWGAPTGAAVENNFAGGTASLAVTSAAVAEIITVLKAVGFLGT